MSFFQILAGPDVGSGMQLGAWVVALASAIILHEVSHGLVAYWLGDPTAKYAGRLTLNPIKHIDLWGSVILPLLLIVSRSGVLFGWAKPVPVNYYNLRAGKYGPVLVAFAGPGTNFLLSAIFGFLAGVSPSSTALPFLFFSIAITNAYLMIFNLIPIPPLDGSKILYLFLNHRPDIIFQLERYSFVILIAFLFFGSALISQLVSGPADSLVLFFYGLGHSL